MTTEVRDAYLFNAKILSRGQQDNGTGWRVTVGYKLPPSDRDLVLTGRDEKDLGDLKVGDYANVTIRKGNLKSPYQGKERDGNVTWDFYWNATFSEAVSSALPAEGSDDGYMPDEPPSETFVGKPLPDPAETPQRGSQEPPSNDIQTRIERGMAFNAAYTLLAAHTDWLSDKGLEYDIRVLRDRLLPVIQTPVAPPHFCYVHESTRRPGSKTGAWVHLIDGDREQPCFEDQEQQEEAEQQSISYDDGLPF